MINTGPVSRPITDERIEENDAAQMVIHSFGDPKPMPMESILIKEKVTPLQLSPSPRFGQQDDGTEGEPSSNRGIQFVSISEDENSKTNPEDSVETLEAKAPLQGDSLESRPEESSWSLHQKNSPEYKELRELIRASEALLEETNGLKGNIAKNKNNKELPQDKIAQNLERIKNLVNGVSKIEKK